MSKRGVKARTFRERRFGGYEADSGVTTLNFRLGSRGAPSPAEPAGLLLRRIRRFTASSGSLVPSS